MSEIEIEFRIPSWLAAWQALYDGARLAAYDTRLIYPNHAVLYWRVAGSGEPWRMQIAPVIHNRGVRALRAISFWSRFSPIHQSA